MTYYIEGAVTVEEIARALRSTPAEVEGEVRTFGISLGLDWAGRAAVSEQDAQGLASGRARANYQQAIRHTELQRRAAEWEAERSAVTASASTDAYRAAVKRGVSAGDAHAQGSSAAGKAGYAFERKLPRELEDYVGRIYTQRPVLVANEVA